MVQDNELDSDLKIEHGSGNLFFDLGLANSEELQIKSDLALVIRQIIKDEGLSQATAAEKMGVTQPEVSHIMNAKISKFSLRKLFIMLVHLGRNLTISIEKSDKEVGEMHLTCA